MGGGISVNNPEGIYSIPFLLIKVLATFGDENRKETMRYLSMIETKFHGHYESYLLKSTIDFCQNDGVSISINLMRKYIRDVELVRMCISIFDYQKRFGIFARKVIESEGISLFDKLKFTYLHDDYIGTILPKLEDNVLTIGCNTARRIIINQGNNLVLCKCCQLAVEKMEYISEDKHVKPEDRVISVIQYLLWYKDIIDVQISCLDTLIIFSRNGKKSYIYIYLLFFVFLNTD